MNIRARKEVKMSTNDTSVVATNNEEAQRYEVKIDEQLAVLTYKRQGNHIIFLHTGVPAVLAGHGIASKLASFALEEARSQKLTVVPMCPFVADYIRHHQEYLSLLDPIEQSRLLEV